jgi:UDP-2,3-diacylglucosamine pyrophosphatase LpxH
MAEIAAWAQTPQFDFRASYLRPPSPTTQRINRPSPSHRKARHRTIFISDTHLGTKGCKADLLADFLNHNTCDTLYLVGDIVDGWRLKHRWFWPENHNRVLDALLAAIDRGTRIVYVPGNHDEVLRGYCGRVVAGVEVCFEAIHETADGRKLLIVHGDQFDQVIACAKWLAHAGDWAYSAALELNEIFNGARRSVGLGYWSLSAWLKQKVKNALEYICRFELAVADHARARGFDGVVCGHIHHATIKDIGGVLYLNDGDWVESCTALVEDAGGRLEILRWTTLAEEHAHAPTAAPADAVAVPA